MSAKKTPTTSADRSHPMNRTARTLLCVGVSVGTLLVSATPGSAAPTAAAKTSTYAAHWVSGTSGAVRNATDGLTLNDYASLDSVDHVSGTPNMALLVDTLATNNTPAAASTTPCTLGTYSQSGLSFAGDTSNWDHAAIGALQHAHIRIACLIGGVQHRLYWGMRAAADGNYVLPHSNCVELTRTSQSTFTLNAPLGCLAQDRVVNKSGQEISSYEGDLSFGATITVAGLV